MSTEYRLSRYWSDEEAEYIYDLEARHYMKWFKRKKHEVKLQDLIIFAKDKDGTPIECENCGLCLKSVNIVLVDDKQYKRADRLFDKIVEDRKSE